MSEEEQSGSARPSRVRPMVGRSVGNGGVLAFAGVLAVGAAALFVSLENRRSRVENAGSLAEQGETAGTIASAPMLSIPQDYATSAPVVLVPAMPSPAPIPARPAAIAAPPLRYTAQPAIAAPSAPPPAPRSEVVFDAGKAPPKPVEDGGDKNGERVRASRFANPATTVPKGTVIQAVMESALDSTRAGLARAIISRDVYSFDGSHVLIARGSRLVGEYKADLTSGQSRALIQWQRLMRPDGVIINLDSPSADPLGRAGLKGKVNGHFLERYGSAIMQSALDLGVQVGTGKLANSTTIYTLPSLYGLSASANSSRTSQQNVQPTLTVKQGASVSVFVARDLDFTSVEP